MTGYDPATNELNDIKDILKSIKKSLETNAPLKGLQTETLTQILKQIEITICSLEHISKQTCESLNELHYQTDLQQSIQKSLILLLDLYLATHTGNQISEDKIRTVGKYIEENYAFQKPKPICEYQPCSRIPPTSESPGKTSVISVNPGRVSGGQFPPQDILGEEEERNPERVPDIPIGPLRGPLSPSRPPVSIFKGASKPDEVDGRTGAVIFEMDDPFGDRVTFSGIPPDMSGAMNDKVVFMTGNTFAAISTDGGDNFTNLSITSIFGPDINKPANDTAGNSINGGICCDQVVQYAPSIDRFIWLMQFKPSATQVNTFRIAVASTEDMINSGGTSWTFWDFHSGDFGLRTWMDYPDMSIGTNFLYISIDAVGQKGPTPPRFLGGLLVVRIPLEELKLGGTINSRFTTDPQVSSVAYACHITQNTEDEVFWAGHISDSKIRVFNWHESSDEYFSRDIDINSWPRDDYTSFCQDGTDWLNKLSDFPRWGIIGATRRKGFFGVPLNEVWFAWTAGRGGDFPHPHVQVLQVDINKWTTTQWQIWNPDHAFAYPCLATNINLDVGISLGFGGKPSPFFASHAVGFLGDFIVWYSELSNAALNRWGDYVTVRRANPNGDYYAAVGYSVLQNTPPATGNRFNPRYILFGRPRPIIK